jgi:hypothetical protein
LPGVPVVFGSKPVEVVSGMDLVHEGLLDVVSALGESHHGPLLGLGKKNWRDKARAGRTARLRTARRRLRRFHHRQSLILPFLQTAVEIVWQGFPCRTACL